VPEHQIDTGTGESPYGNALRAYPEEVAMSGDSAAPARLRRISNKTVGAALALIVAAVAVGVWLATIWEAASEPTSSIGTSAALRGWLAVLAALGTVVATGFLVWFARRVPEGVDGLLKRLDDAEEARRKAEQDRQNVEAQRDTLATRLSRPYLHGEALPAGATTRKSASVSLSWEEELLPAWRSVFRWGACLRR